MTKKWKLLKTHKENIGHPWYPLEMREYLNPEGKKIEWIIHPGSDVVNVFAMTKSQKVIILRQYRPGIDMMETALAAGGVKPGSTPLQNAKWELEEEAGYVSKNWKYLGKIARSSGKSTAWQYMYLALDCEKTAQKLGENEFIDVLLKSLAEFKKLLLNGKIQDIGCAFAGYKGLEYLKKV